MKRFFLSLVGFGLCLALLLGKPLNPLALTPRVSLAQAPPPTDQTPGAVQFDSIVLDFQETPQVLSGLPDTLTWLNQNLSLQPTLNSEFSEADHIYVVRGDRTLLERLLASDLAAQTEFIEPNYIYKTTGLSVNDPDYAKQWNLKQIKVEDAWAKGATGKGATVAVIDTGVSQGPDLAQTELVPGYDFVNDRVDAADDHGHGTHVAGTIAQSTNNKYGVAGVAYEAKIMPLKVLSRAGSGTIADIAEAIRFAADQGADVINMSLGGGGDSKLMREAIDYAHSREVVIVAAAGNESNAQASYPAFYPHVIAVSAIGPDETKTPYSNYGEGVDIAAPGGDTRQDALNGILQETINPRTPEQFEFKAFQGTSMAAPHVAGVAALIKAQNRNLSPAEVWMLLQQSARPVEGDSQNHFGAGYLDASKAVKPSLGIGFDWQRLNGKSILARLTIAAILIGILVPRKPQFNPWRLTFLTGILLGSVGFFVLQGVEISGVPSGVFRLLGSAIPEMGGAFWQDPRLNPLFVNTLIPFGLMALFISHRMLKWFVLGLSVGMMAFIAWAWWEASALLWLGTGPIAQLYLLINLLFGGIVTALSFRMALKTQEPMQRS
ncbi:MAG: S8 family serine peptidase [Cyanobacteria bacterium P01_G01_bin.54]